MRSPHCAHAHAPHAPQTGFFGMNFWNTVLDMYGNNLGVEVAWYALAGLSAVTLLAAWRSRLLAIVVRG